MNVAGRCELWSTHFDVNNQRNTNVGHFSWNEDTPMNITMHGMFITEFKSYFNSVEKFKFMKKWRRYAVYDSENRFVFFSLVILKVFPVTLYEVSATLSLCEIKSAYGPDNQVRVTGHFHCSLQYASAVFRCVWKHAREEYIARLYKRKHIEKTMLSWSS